LRAFSYQSPNRFVVIYLKKSIKKDLKEDRKYLAGNIKFGVNFSPLLFWGQAIFQGMEIVIRGLSPHLFWVTSSVRGGARGQKPAVRGTC